MVQQHPYSTIWEKKIVIILHISETRAVFLLFCDYQETKSE